MNSVIFSVDGRPLKISGDLKLSSISHLYVNGQPITVQPSAPSVDEIELIYKGTVFKFKVMPAVCEDLIKYMKEKPKLDLTRVVVAPMPGSIKNVSVKEGQMVRKKKFFSDEKCFRLARVKKSR